MVKTTSQLYSEEVPDEISDELIINLFQIMHRVGIVEKTVTSSIIFNPRNFDYLHSELLKKLPKENSSVSSCLFDLYYRRD